MPHRARRSTPSSFGSLAARTPAVAAGQRIGLLGGSFNPPHAAHRMASQLALKRLGLDRIWWLVTPGNPLKTRDELADLDDRMAACRRLAADPRIVPTVLESGLPTSFTALTLAYLARRHPRVRFVWIMGADNLAGFHRWQHWREIAATMPIAVVDRPGWRHRAIASPAGRALAPFRVPEERASVLADLAPPCWTFLTGPLSTLSSTALRRQAKSSAPVLLGRD
jgi:nicotinate-nucleotide adenylyltransferase